MRRFSIRASASYCKYLCSASYTEILRLFLQVWALQMCCWHCTRSWRLLQGRRGWAGRRAGSPGMPPSAGRCATTAVDGRDPGTATCAAFEMQICHLELLSDVEIVVVVLLCNMMFQSRLLVSLCMPNIKACGCSGAAAAVLRGVRGRRRWAAGCLRAAVLQCRGSAAAACVGRPGML